jgi:hypothetical protein
MKIVWISSRQYHPGLKLELRPGKTYEVPEAIAIGEEEIADFKIATDPETGDQLRDEETDELVKVEIPGSRRTVQRGWISQGVARLPEKDDEPAKPAAPPKAEKPEKADKSQKAEKAVDTPPSAPAK